MDIEQTILDDSPYVVRLVTSGRWHDHSADEEWEAWCRQSAATIVVPVLVRDNILFNSSFRMD